MGAKVKSSTAEQAGRFSRSDKICLTVCAALVVGMLAISPHLPDSGPKIIREKLMEAGYSVDSVDFALIEKGSVWDSGRIYQASMPIEYASGIFVDHWRLESRSMGSFTSWHSVTPHPEIPPTVPVNLRLSITQEDYNRIGELAGEDAVDEYITRLIYEWVREGGADE